MAACLGSKSRETELTTGDGRASTQGQGHPRACLDAGMKGSREGLSCHLGGIFGPQKVPL